MVSSIPALSELNPYPLKDGRKSERVASLSSTAAGLLRDFFKSSSEALYFKKSLRRQGIGFRRYFFLIVRIRSLDVSGIAEDDGSFVTVHFRNVCPGEARSSTLHRPCGQRSAARHSLWAGQARTTLRFRFIASAPDLPGKR